VEVCLTAVEGQKNMNKHLILLCIVAPVLVLCDPEADAEAGGYYGRHYGGGYRRGYGYHGGYKRHYGGYSGGHARSYSYHDEHRSHPVCKIVYDTTYSTECATSFEQACTTVSETQYRTEYDTACTQVSQKQCSPVTRQVPDKECATRYEQACVNEAKTVTDVAYVEECKDIEHKVCQETQLIGVQRQVQVQQIAQPADAIVAQPAVVPALPAAAVVAQPAAAIGTVAAAGPLAARLFAAAGAPGVPAAIRLHKRKAEAEPEADAEPTLSLSPYSGVHHPIGIAAPACRGQVERVCQKVPVKTQRLIQTPKCTTVPKTDCVATLRSVVDTVCVDRPVEQCSKVARQVPFEVPRKECHNVPQKHCKQVPHKAARKVCKNVSTHSYSHRLHH